MKLLKSQNGSIAKGTFAPAAMLVRKYTRLAGASFEPGDRGRRK